MPWQIVSHQLWFVTSFHRRTGLEIIFFWGGGGGGGADMNLPKAQEPLGGPGTCSPERFLKNRVFNPISRVLEWVFIHRASDE